MLFCCLHHSSIWLTCGIALRLTKTGVFDYRNAGAYVATTVAYSANKTYRIKIVANLTAKTFDLYIGEIGTTPVKVAQNIAFRTDGVSINNIGKILITGGSGVVSGQFYIKNHIVYTPQDCQITRLATTSTTISADISSTTSGKKMIIFALFDNKGLKSIITKTEELTTTPKTISANFSINPAGFMLPYYKILVWDENLSPKLAVYNIR